MHELCKRNREIVNHVSILLGLTFRVQKTKEDLHTKEARAGEPIVLDAVDGEIVFHSGHAPARIAWVQFAPTEMKRAAALAPLSRAP